MHLQADGDIQIQPGETIQVVVTAIRTHYLAIFGSLLQSQWAVVLPVQPIDSKTTREVRTFIAPAGGREAFALSCDFVRDLQGKLDPVAEYRIDVSGTGPFTLQKRILPIPPFPVTRPFLFEVVP